MNYANLFKLLEITRFMPQYGYALAGMSKQEQSDLAQHHYLVAMIAWQICDFLQAQGCDIDTAKTLKLAMLHDLGELFGGDINWYYGRANAVAKAHAKAFEKENAAFLSTFFPEHGQFKKLHDEIFAEKTIESVVAKLGDYLECSHYKFLVGKGSEADRKAAMNASLEKSEKITDEKSKEALKTFVTEWFNQFDNNEIYDFLLTNKL
ncbi:MAG TPA: HD domain-containing protein [Patescibacteria group bacterium]|nr:HD domain-containing protein [Patescibacteria group bacterium]